jgi:hypothetical protein
MKLGSDHSEQDRSDEGERSEQGQHVNPTVEKHNLVSPLVALSPEAASRQVPGEAKKSS